MSRQRDAAPANPSQNLIGENWLKARDFPEIDRIDLSWMQELFRYDHWDPFATNIFKSWYSNEPEPTWIDAPMPNFLALLAYSKLRLMRAVSSGEMESGLREVRHLAKLAYSTETLIGTAVAVRILRYERDAHLYATDHDLAVNWSSESHEGLERALNTAFAFASFAGVATSPDLLVRVVGDTELQFGRCAGITEGVLRASSYRAELGATPIAMPDFSEGYRLLDEAFERNADCRFTMVKVNQSLGHSTVGILFEELSEPDAFAILTRDDRYAALISEQQWATVGLRDRVISTPGESIR